MSGRRLFSLNMLCMSMCGLLTLDIDTSVYVESCYITAWSSLNTVLVKET